MMTAQRIALVTGANRGIGFEIARRLGEKGITVLIGARDGAEGASARDALADQGMDAHSIRLDVTDQTTVEAAVGRIRDTFGRLDILVNNAGIMVDQGISVLGLSPGMLQKTLETNAFAPLLLSQACVPMMQSNNYGRIVNLSSTLGSLTDIMHPDSTYPDIGNPAYRMSKTLLNSITVLLAKALQRRNILVNAVCPGWVRTRLGGPEAPLTPAEAAATPVWLATLPDDGPTGGFFREHQPIPW